MQVSGRTNSSSVNTDNYLQILERELEHMVLWIKNAVFRALTDVAETAASRDKTTATKSPTFAMTAKL